MSASFEPHVLHLLEERLGYTFSERQLLLQALTHTSYGHEFQQKDNERLEFLGDSILDVIVSDLLLETFPEANEGTLTKMRAALVNEKALSDVTQSLRLQDHLRLGKGEMLTGGHMKPSILSSAFEALIAAVYLDGGFHAVYPVIRHLFAPLFQSQNQTGFFRDYKTQLQEKLQSQYKQTPIYRLLGSDGPDHAKVFKIEVLLSKTTLAEATGYSKKQAEQNAAKLALEALDSLQQKESETSL